MEEYFSQTPGKGKSLQDGQYLYVLDIIFQVTTHWEGLVPKMKRYVQFIDSQIPIKEQEKVTIFTSTVKPSWKLGQDSLWQWLIANMDNYFNGDHQHSTRKTMGLLKSITRELFWSLKKRRLVLLPLLKLGVSNHRCIMFDELWNILMCQEVGSYIYFNCFLGRSIHILSSVSFR